ncbi:MAG: SRPBCC family protein [Flavobacteriales bacterium]|nr:SRPBCC family protein [Flavobacteriales bacterium]MCW8912034.1 SRPBCC family protein [Flavobacteriales bacterium]MCW8936674.1 SRPBCC family protein [Flavobacteriales bacterium]MCW8939573.1 SRPBCC family protein [Flavobacteriales bacterium]MCW8968472.1 SRPBCC family protein [Flavobacteriales bacterium]
MKALKIIGIIVLILILTVVVLAFVAPTDFKLERSIEINAQKETVHKHLLYFENSQKWSPWAELDPNQKTWMEGEDGAVGTTFFWEGNEDVGKGKQEIITITDDKIETTVTFIEPFESVANGYFLLSETEGKTTVTWGFDSKMPRPFNVMGLFMDISESVGKDYEKGLAKLKEIVENEKPATKEYAIETVNFEEKTFLTHREKISFNDMQAFFSQHFGGMYGMLTQNKEVQITGQPCAIYYDWDEENQMTDVAAAIPYSSGDKNFKFDNYTTVKLGGEALKIAYYGNYENLAEPHMAIHEYLEKNNLPMSHVVLEEYITDLTTEADTSKWLTNIYYFESKPTE